MASNVSVWTHKSARWSGEAQGLCQQCKNILYLGINKSLLLIESLCSAAQPEDGDKFWFLQRFSFLPHKTHFFPDPAFFFPISVTTTLRTTYPGSEGGIYLTYPGSQGRIYPKRSDAFRDAN